VLALGGICLVALLAGMVPAVGWLLPLWLLGGLANGVLNVLVGVLVIRRAPQARRGRAGAALGGTLNAATTVGYGAGGLLMTLTGDPRAIMMGAGLAGAVVCAIIGTPLLTAVRSTGRAAGGPLPSAAGRG
jgi:MFS family permease